MADQSSKSAWIARVLSMRLPEKGETEAVSPSDTLRDRLSRLEPAYLRVMKLDPPERTKLSALMASAQEHLESGAADKAVAAMDRLETLLGTNGTAAKPVLASSTQRVADVAADPGQLAAYRKALQQWETARQDARAQLTGLRNTISGRSPELRNAATVLDAVTARLNDELSTAINAALNARDADERTDRHEQAATLARDYLTRVYFDPVFACVDRNPVAPLTVRDVLGDALKAIVAALPE
jgi:hypothetical protein